ncbi:Gag-Pol polyprotein [Vitis vinifera]|uniref:Gag-Pol polyprotein n=1 Tax=Vitis vinifera TaxID=29760 RepID=A0A438GFP9_VITVI|nr:Gag-Pol polyprotein [Vitis vinifera]
METDCCQFVQRCPECQIHGDLIHVPLELHALTSPWPFSVWGIDIIGKISPKSSSGHEFILVAIDYFTKWVEAASYARLTSSGVASFIRSHIICRYGVPHELISDRGVHFRAEVDTLVQRYSIRHHRSSAYRPQTNGAVEAANKNIKRILRRMVETSRDWSEKLPFALWAYRTSFRTSTGATPYSLVYGMEAMLPVEIEMGSLRVALEQQIPEADWAQARFDQLNLLDERRLRAADHVRAYQRKMARAFKKRVKPRPRHVGDLVLKVIRGLIRDPRGKFRPNWSGPYFIRELTPEGAAWLMDLDGNRFSEPTNVDQLKRSITTIHCFAIIFIVACDSSHSLRVLFSPYSDPSQVRCSHSRVHGSWDSLYMLHFIYEGMSFDHWVFEPSFLSFLSPYHLGLRYVPCLKTTLRPWDQMSSSAASYLDRSDSVVFRLPGSFMDPHGLARPSLTGCSSRRGHDRLPYGASEIHPAGSALLDTWIPSCLSTWETFMEVACAMMDDFMTFVLRTCRAPDVILGHISRFGCMLIPTHEIHMDTMFPPWSLSGVTQLGLHFAMPRCHHVFLPGDALLIYGSDSVVHVDDLDRAFDDGLTFRVTIITFQFRRSEPSPCFQFRRSEPSPCFQFRRSEPLSVFRSTFRVIIIISQLRRSESSSLLGFGVQSHHRVFSFGVQSHHRFSDRHSESHPQFSAFRAIIGFSDRHSESHPQFWRSEPSLLLVGVQSHDLYFQFGVQSLHHFSVLAFRAIIAFQFWRSEPSSLFSISLFRATTSFQFGIQSHIFT